MGYKHNMVVQFTADEISSLQDNKFLKHGDRKRKLLNPIFKKIAGGRTAVFEVPSSKYKENGEKYNVEMMFPEITQEYLKQGLSVDEILTLVLKMGDVKVSCSCPAFRYWGYAYITTVLDAKYGVGEKERPDEKNPNERGVVCKHLGRTLDYLQSNNFNLLRDKFRPIVEKLVNNNNSGENNNDNKELEKELLDDGVEVEIDE